MSDMIDNCHGIGHAGCGVCRACTSRPATSAELIALLDDPKIYNAVRVPGEPYPHPETEIEEHTPDQIKALRDAANKAAANLTNQSFQEGLAAQLSAALVARDESRFKTIAFVYRHKILAALQPQPADPYAAKRWEGVIPLVEQITAEEGATVTFVCPNPDFNGLPNEVVTVNRGPDWQDTEYRGDTLADCLRAAIEEVSP